VFDSLRGCQFAVEAHRDVQPLGKRQAAGANPAIGTKFALQALKAERRIRNPEVDRAIRSWGTSHGSLTQRDRDPPFKRSDPGAIPGRPTKLPVTHRKRCARLVSGRGEVQVLSRAPNRESEAGRVLHAVANRWVPSSRHGLRVVRSPPIQRLACGVLSRLEPDDDPLRVVSVRLAQPLPTLEGEVRRARTLVSKTSGIRKGVWIETDRLPPIWEREPGSVRGLSGKQTVPLAACDSGSPRSASLGRSS
jgi:hypothetical protein